MIAMLPLATADTEIDEIVDDYLATGRLATCGQRLLLTATTTRA
jgi:hypothetical protein